MPTVTIICACIALLASIANAVKPEKVPAGIPLIFTGVTLLLLSTLPK